MPVGLPTVIPVTSIAHSATTGQVATDHHSNANDHAPTNDHVEAHTVASHSDTTGTGAELESLTDGSEIALHSHSNNAKIATGSYTGDGTEDQGITGIGFQPSLVLIALRVTAAGGMSNRGWLTSWDTMLDNNAAGLCISWVGAEVYQHIIDAIISHDADGFSVDDAGANTHPNTNAAVYDFVAIG